MMTDPLADMSTRIRNASNVKHTMLALPYSRLKEQLVKLLVKTGHLGSYEVTGNTTKHCLAISKFNLESVKRLSKPENQLYAEHSKLWFYLRGRGETILSTSKGLMTNRQARQQRLGGEVMMEIW